jgi:hypothetical protein
MDTELKTALCKIANAAMDMKEDKINELEYEQQAVDALMQVKNLTIPRVSLPKGTVCRCQFQKCCLRNDKNECTNWHWSCTDRQTES